MADNTEVETVTINGVVCVVKETVASDFCGYEQLYQEDGKTPQVDEQNRPLARKRINHTSADLSSYPTTEAMNEAIGTATEDLATTEAMNEKLAKTGGTLTGALNGTTLTMTGLITGIGTKETVIVADDGVCDVSKGTFFNIAPSGNITVSLSNMQAGQVIAQKITNGGAVTITWPAAWKWASGSAPELQASGTDLVTVYYDGTDYLASSSTAYASI